MINPRTICEDVEQTLDRLTALAGAGFYGISRLE
jgi:hypothetical protein